ncbi:hypothetical protein TWF106_006442 [Orbilia oligospora]|uniref:Uncharacterized protein n=1 Tax=Orbilia oligospora TaxID=2813651 RepID=A0A7C8URQ2_ORBOL|nr:hypothetical protein TWF106_006442 [Orbilia oligospora]
MGPNFDKPEEDIVIFSDEERGRGRGRESNFDSNSVGDQYYRRLTPASKKNAQDILQRLNTAPFCRFNTNFLRKKICAESEKPESQREVSLFKDILDNYNHLEAAVMTHVEAVYSFLKWLVLDNQNIKTQSTFRNQFSNFRSFYRWKTGNIYPPEIGQQIDGKLKDFVKIAKCFHPDNEKPKTPVAGDDFINIINFNWQHDEHSYLNERYRVQLALAIHILAFTAVRPGSVVQTENRESKESAIEQSTHDEVDQDQSISGDGLDRPGEDTPEEEVSIQVLRYSHIKIYAYYNPDPQFERQLCFKVLVAIRYHKGKRELETTTYPLYMNKDPSLCPVLLLISLGFVDNAFANISSPSQLKGLLIPHGRETLELAWKKSSEEVAIFRMLERQGGKTGEISNDREKVWRVQRLRTLLSDLGKRAGYKNSLHPRCFRYGTSNAASKTLNELELGILMGHAPSSKMFRNHYQNKEVKWNIQNMLLENSCAEKAYECPISAMNLTRDLNAPSKLPKELLGIYKTDKKWLRYDKRYSRLQILANQGAKNVSTKDLKKAMNDRDNRRRWIVDNEMRKYRKAYFDNASANIIKSQLSGNWKDTSDMEVRPGRKYRIPSRAQLVDILKLGEKTYESWWKALDVMITLAQDCEGNYIKKEVIDDGSTPQNPTIRKPAPQKPITQKPTRRRTPPNKSKYKPTPEGRYYSERSLQPEIRPNAGQISIPDWALEM